MHLLSKVKSQYEDVKLSPYKSSLTGLNLKVDIYKLVDPLIILSDTF